MTKYQDWIAANVPQASRGSCAEITKRMAEAFPELRRVRGHYVSPDDGERPHWWCEAPDGRIIDPTVGQFAGANIGTYEEYVGPEPTGKCLNCGALVFTTGNFCSDACATETTAEMNLSIRNWKL